MRLLFDQNLPFKLVRLLADIYPDSVHARDLDLIEADDLTIWRYAAEHDLVIVSKDSDFHQMSLLHISPAQNRVAARRQRPDLDHRPAAQEAPRHDAALR